MTREYSYTSLRDYEDFIDSNSHKVNTLKIGKFYSLLYDFKLNPNYPNIPQKELAYYDVYPLVFLYKWYVAKGDKLVWRGLNLHHLTYTARLDFLKIIFEMFDLENKNPSNVINLNWTMLEAICERHNPKLSLGFRQYIPERVYRMVQIDTDKIMEASKFTAPTYEAKNYRNIYQRYISFQPKI